MTEISDTIDILLSTFNSEKYLREQIDSIIEQTYTNWKLIIRDDGSSDNTKKIICEYCKTYPDKIILVTDTFGNLGYKNSFVKLMAVSTADYILFSDHDDHWHKSKIEVLLAEMKSKETPENKPILVCCDLSICDENLNLLEASYFKHINLDLKSGNQVNLLTSQLHGCTFLFNKPLLVLCNKIISPVKGLDDFLIHGHDNFLSVVCAIRGKIYYVNRSLVNHRIHDENSIGFSKAGKKKLMVQFKGILKYCFNNKAYRNDLFSSKIKENKQIIEALIKLDETGVPSIYSFFLNIERSNYFYRKFINCFYPFLIHYSATDRFIYIVCF